MGRGQPTSPALRPAQLGDRVSPSCCRMGAVQERKVLAADRAAGRCVVAIAPSFRETMIAHTAPELACPVLEFRMCPRLFARLSLRDLFATVPPAAHTGTVAGAARVALVVRRSERRVYGLV